MCEQSSGTEASGRDRLVGADAEHQSQRIAGGAAPVVGFRRTLKLIDRAFSMYEAFYNLREKPFSILPDPDLIYWAHTHRLAFSMLEFGVTNNAGFTVITGEIGSGKTTLVRHLLRMIDAHVTVGLISFTPNQGKDLLRWIMMALDQPHEGDSTNLFKRFQEFVQYQRFRRRRVILIIDEAQNLGLEALEELRMLSNINADKDQALQLMLVGQPQLRNLLRSPQLLQFAQRISSDFHLTPLAPNEVMQYIDFRLQAVGAQYHLFTEEACAVVADASRGIPRLINILCDTALVYGFSAQSDYITADLVHSVIDHKTQYGSVQLADQRR